MTGRTPSGRTALSTRAILLRSMVVVVATAIAVLAIAGWRWWDTVHRQDLAAGALDAATTLTVQLLSTDAAGSEADLTADRTLVTGDLAARFDDVVAPLGGREPGFTTRAQVVRSAVVSAAAEGAVVLLYVDQVSTSDVAPPRRTAHQVVVTLAAAEDGRWLVSGLEPA
ncbi:hypothetical protein [Pseudonocardia sp.]|uniref:hypothetical protein n=1 Tax=Pseudonocardia sp. TaxID=60912 RepID=UPI003D0972C5